MRNILPILATAALLGAAAAQAATPTESWSVAVQSTRGGQLAPAAGGAAAVDAAGDLYVAATQGGTAEACIVTLKVSGASGAIAWRREACGPRYTTAGALALDRAGNVLVTGTTGSDARTLKYAAADGALLWDQRIRGSGQSIAIDADGNAIVAGMVANDTRDLRVARLSGSNGTVAWERVLDSGGDDEIRAVAVDAAGQAFALSTSRNARGDGDWWLVKLSRDGVVAWHRTFDSGGADAAAALVVDPSGNPVVTGSAAAGEVGVIRTIKFAAATGSNLWDRSFGTRGSNAGTAIAIDSRGDIAVAGHVFRQPGDDDIQVLRYRGADGALLWQASFAGTRAGQERARAVDIDAQGEVAITGVTFTAGEANPDLRTIKYGADGAQEWTAAYRAAGSGPEDSGHDVVAVPGVVFAVGLATEPLVASSLRISRYADAPTARAASANVQGLWWRAPAGSESGWGLNVTQQGEILFATWFTYDANGQPTWFVMSRGERVGDDIYEGALYEVKGSPFHAFDPAAVAATPIGSARLSFADGDNGTFAYTVKGIAGSRPIARHVFSGPVPACAVGGTAGSAPNYQDMWWNAPSGSESGWGVQLTHQGDVIFVAWFTYGNDGRPTWVFGSNVARTGEGAFEGTLYRSVGPPFTASPWDASKVSVAAVGRVSLTFDGVDSGRFHYTLDGVTQSKAITRQVYANPKSVCR